MEGLGGGSNKSPFPQWVLKEKSRQQQDLGKEVLERDCSKPLRRDPSSQGWRSEPFQESEGRVARLETPPNLTLDGGGQK